MATQSIYRPIDGPDTIRLLRLLKGTKNYEVDPIRCELFEAPLPDGDDDEAYYEALSYTWGDASETGTIIIDHRPTTVTENLHKALGHLRQTDEDRILWVDALCINQGDHSERMHQVGKMGNIYKKAREVIIWLGTITEKIDLFFRAVQHLDQEMIRIPKPRTDEPVYLEIWLDTARRHLEKLKTMDLEVHEMRVQGLQELLARDWWRRIWVIQEAASAARARIQCSWRSVPTRTFALMPQLMGISPGPREEALLEVLPGPLRKHSWWHTDRSLETLLEKFQYSESKEECDQIYALLGMSSEAATPGMLLQADYSIDTTRVVQNTVSFLAFGELVDLVTCPLPTWNLSNLRKAMPTLLPNLLEWALSNNQLPLTWKLLFNREQPLQVPTVSKPLPTRFLRPRLPSWASSRHSSRSLQLRQSEESADSSLLTPLQFVISASRSSGGSAAVYIHCGLNFDVFHGFHEMPRSACSRGSIDWPDLIRLLSGCQDIKLMPRYLHPFRPEYSAQSMDVRPVEVCATLDRSILKDYGWRLLHLAIRMRCRHSIEMLLEYEEVDVNHAEASFTPLSLAASLGDDWLVGLLLTRSDLRNKSLDAGGLSPLERAFEGNWRTTAALLLAQEGGSLPPKRDAYFLRKAIEKDWVEITEALISQGVSPDATSATYHQSPPLALAMQLHYPKMINTLLMAGADPNPSPPEKAFTTGDSDEEEWCPIVLAIQSGSPSLLQSLLSIGRGANTATWNTPNEDPLIYAIRGRHVSMVRMLLARGANVEARTARRKLSSFWLAVEYNAPKIMRLLADSGADLTITASSHPSVYQGEWSLRFTPWFQQFLAERQLSFKDLWRLGENDICHDKLPPLKRWKWEMVGPELGLQADSPT